MSRQRIHLRDVQPGDEPILFEVYANTRLEELAITGWSAAQIHAFLAIPPAVAEIGMVGYLLWLGLRLSPRTSRSAAAA